MLDAQESLNVALVLGGAGDSGDDMRRPACITTGALQKCTPASKIPWHSLAWGTAHSAFNQDCSRACWDDEELEYIRQYVENLKFNFPDRIIPPHTMVINNV